ncbi:histidine kinase [Ectothiorhodospiraceae bacterium WFHF3C12]|nr:histidine kinase [Ectothiorhodospiraceae bacterium WFHF3C12]
MDTAEPTSLPARLAAWPWPARLAAVLVLNSAIGALLTIIGFGGTLGVNLLFSHFIGLSILLGTELVFGLIPPRRTRLRLAGAVAAVALGSLGGTALGIWLLIGGDVGEALPDAVYRQSIMLGLFFGAICIVLFTAADRLRRARERVREQQLDVARSEQASTEAQLRMLRAQVEPHFLFNALANVASLIESDPPRARAMLERLNDYLRSALRHSREATATLDQELELISQHVALLNDRMPGRLDLVVDVPYTLRRTPLPPMLLQPLVENAIKHGLEPRPGGGRITISAGEAEGGMSLSVHDDGLGLRGSGGAGSGLANLRARLRSLYAGDAALSLGENAAGGVTATIRLPVEAS